MICSKALNPKAEPFFLNHVHPVYKSPCHSCIPPFIYQIPPTFLYLLWQQPSCPNPEKMESKRKLKKGVKGKRRVSAPVKPTKPRKKLGEDNPPAVGTSWVNKWVPKKENLLYAKQIKTASVIPFPASLAGQNSSRTTTLMIKNIPNQFQRRDLLSLLSKHCRDENLKAVLRSDPTKSEFDFLYLPMDFQKFWCNNKVANLGYAFVNFTSSIAARRFYKEFHNEGWDVELNNKIREITCAKIQGLEALRANFERKTFWCHTDEYLPVIAAPPCDGVRLSNLIAVGNCVGAPSGARVRKHYC